MSRTRAYSAIFALIIALALTPAARAGDAEDQRVAASAFLQAYVRQDIATVRNHVPDTTQEMFGKYPFTGAIKLDSPKVDDRQALVPLTGAVNEPCCPGKGGVLLRKDDGEWKVRQVLFYDQVPKLLNLPSRSITTTDRNQEGTVKAVAQRFLDAWKKADVKAMDALTYKWAAVNKEPIKGLAMSKLSVSNTTSSQGEPMVKYAAKITYRWGIVSYTLDFKGGLVLVKDRGAWRVRGSILLFDF
jgi:hypothetical protein